MNPAVLVVLFAGGFGLLIGSFLNVCIVRWPARESVVRPRSRCPRCGNLIAWYDNIPIASWLALGARCRHCKLPIPWHYPLIELGVAVLWAFCAWGYGPQLEGLRAAVFGTLLIGIAVTDAREYIIPDEFSIGGLVIGLVFAVATPWLAPVHMHALLWPQAVVGAVVGFVLLWTIAFLGTKALGQEAMGGGDIKMMAMVGAFLGWSGVLLTLFLGAVLGTVIFLPIKLSGRNTLVPFGIFLAVGAAASWVFGPAIITWYLHFIAG